jgi:hypothetical protein
MWNGRRAAGAKACAMTELHPAIEYAERFGLRDGDWSPEEAALVSLVDRLRYEIEEAVDRRDAMACALR